MLVVNVGPLTRSTVRRMMHREVSLTGFEATVFIPRAKHDALRLVDSGRTAPSPSDEEWDDSGEDDSLTDMSEMCSPQSFPPSPQSRYYLLSKFSEKTDDVIFRARDELRCAPDGGHGAALREAVWSSGIVRAGDGLCTTEPLDSLSLDRDEDEHQRVAEDFEQRLRDSTLRFSTQHPPNAETSYATANPGAGTSPPDGETIGESLGRLLRAAKQAARAAAEARLPSAADGPATVEAPVTAGNTKGNPIPAAALGFQFSVDDESDGSSLLSASRRTAGTREEITPSYCSSDFECPSAAPNALARMATFNREDCHPLVHLLCGSHAAQSSADQQYCSVRGTLPVPRCRPQQDCWAAYFEVVLQNSDRCKPARGGAGGAGTSDDHGVTIGVSTRHVPLNCAVGSSRSGMDSKSTAAVGLAASGHLVFGGRLTPVPGAHFAPGSVVSVLVSWGSANNKSPGVWSSCSEVSSVDGALSSDDGTKTPRGHDPFASRTAAERVSPAHEVGGAAHVSFYVDGRLVATAPPLPVQRGVDLYPTVSLLDPTVLAMAHFSAADVTVARRVHAVATSAGLVDEDLVLCALDGGFVSLPATA